MPEIPSIPRSAAGSVERSCGPLLGSEPQSACLCTSTSRFEGLDAMNFLLQFARFGEAWVPDLVWLGRSAPVFFALIRAQEALGWGDNDGRHPHVRPVSPARLCGFPRGWTLRFAPCCCLVP